ncbi:hypothetical protein BGY98DRAFT_945583 [Russula aff. rugulosa BPL654]|nr:hypothetical protein BGY98DRAFT_945583 [Russula aff. rugulosa BPL654]
MVLHSGNHEIIGILGIYIAAIKETIDRAKQDISKRERARDPSVDIPPRDEEANPDEDEDLDDYSEKPSRSNKRIRRSGSKRERKGRDGGNAKRHMSGKENDQALLALAAKQNYLCLRFFYDIYDSPYPAIFRRVDEAGSENAPGPAKSQNPPLSETTLMTMSATSIHVTVQSELQPGSTGIVHIGTMAVDLPGPTAKVAVKLAHRMYSHLHSKGVRGIPYILGLFVDAGRLLGAEGPYALVTSYTGVSLSDSSNHASDSLKYSLLETLKSIHTVDILHGDIRLPNFCITPSGEAFVIDFSHATRSCSQEDKDQEIRELSHILGVDSPSEIKSLEKNAGLYRDAKRARYELEGTRSQAQALETALDESTSLVRFASNRSRSIYGSTSNIASTESLIKSI